MRVAQELYESGKITYMRTDSVNLSKMALGMAKKEITEAVEETMKNGRKAIKGKCPTCSTVMFKILGGKAAPTPAQEPANPASTP